MFSNKAKLQVGSEYHESLVSFIKQESESGMISLKKYHRFILLKWVLVLLCLAITFSFLHQFIYSSEMDHYQGSQERLVMALYLYC